MSARNPTSDEVVLYDIDPSYQNKLLGWLSKGKGTVVDISASAQGFRVTVDPGGEIRAGVEIHEGSIEVALDQAMKSKSRTKRVDPEFENRVFEFLMAYDAHLTFGAAKSEFDVVVSNRNAKGQATDEDFEIALVLAEEEFINAQPAHPLPAAEHAALARSLMSPAKREEDLHRALMEPRPDTDTRPVTSRVQVVPRPARPARVSKPKPGAAEDEQLRRALMEPRAELEMNRRLSYRDWAVAVADKLERGGYSLDEAATDYWRQLYQAGFGPQQAAEEFEAAWMSQRGYAGNGAPPVPPRDHRVDALRRVRRMVREEKPFDPGAPRERYAKRHHFSVNTEPNSSGEFSMSGTYRVYSMSPFSGERAPHGYVWGVMGYGGGEGAYEGASAQADEMRQQGFKRVRNLGTSVEWLEPERMHLETNAGDGSWWIRLAGNDIVPTEYRDAGEAERYATRKYGPSGWTVEWLAASS